MDLLKFVLFQLSVTEENFMVVGHPWTVRFPHCVLRNTNFI